MLKKGVKITFLLYVISLFTIAEDGALYIFSNMLFLFFAVFASAYVLNRGSILVNGVLLGFMGFEVYAIFSVLWAPNLSDSVVRVMTVLQLLVMLFLIYNVFSEKECNGFLVNCLWIAGLCLCFYFLTQYSVAEMLESYSMRERLGEKIAPLNAISRNLSIFIVVNMYKIFVEKKKVYILPCLLGILILSTTQSRTGILLCAAGILVLIFSLFKDKKKFFLLLFGVGLLGTAVLAQSSYLQEIFWRVGKMLKFLADTSNSQIDYSAYVRLGLIKDGIHMFLDRPVMGWGIASGYALLGGGYGMYFHNNYIQLLVESGIMGVLLYYGPVVFVLYRICKAHGKDYDILAAALLVMLLVGDFMNSTYYHKITYVLFAIILSICEGKKQVRKGE